MEPQANLQLCNLLARGKTMAQAREILGLDTSPSPVATVGTVETPVATSATGGGEPAAPAATPEAPAAPEGTKPAWMP